MGYSTYQVRRRPIRATGLPAVGGIEAETKMALAKMESVLKAAGCEKEDVVMVPDLCQFDGLLGRCEQGLQ